MTSLQQIVVRVAYDQSDIDLSTKSIMLHSKSIVVQIILIARITDLKLNDDILCMRIVS